MGYYLTSELPEAAQPEKHLRKLLRLPEFGHLVDGDAQIFFLMRGHPQVQQGRQILGTCHMPRVQGRLKDVFLWMLENKFGVLPDFLIELDGEYWNEEAGEREREILVYHELMHADQAIDKHGSPRFDQDGRPVWSIRGHDIEEFDAVVRRYGSHSPELQRFMRAAAEGDERLLA